MQSQATTVEKYLAELPADRRAAIQVVREVILKNLDKKYEEGMQYGMIGYFVPHSVYPAGYHCDPKQPLPYLCLASQKNYMSFYAMSLYLSADDRKWFEQACAKSGKKLNMGKSCIRFKQLSDLPLDVIGKAIKRVPVRKYIALYESTIKTLLSKDSKRGQSAATKIANQRAKTKRQSPPRK